MTDEAPTVADLLEKAQRYCAYQERCRSELVTKLRTIECPPALVDDVIEQLAAENFYDEARFAHAFARGKFRAKSWGRHKIERGLRDKRVDGALIARALAAEIDPDAYRQALEQLIRKKVRTLNPEPFFERRARLLRYLAQKGYEQHLSRDAIDDLREEIEASEAG